MVRMLIISVLLINTGLIVPSLWQISQTPKDKS
jgi:hypothetical protein